MAVSTDHNWAPSRSPSNTTTLSGQTVFVGYGSDTPTKMVPSVSTTKSERLWVKALEEWRDELDARDYRLMKQTPNFNALQRSIQLQKRIYKERTIPRLLDRLSPFLTRLKTFTSVFDTCAQADKIGCIIWGSMKLVIDLASRFKETLQSIVEMFENMDKHLPRFEIYLKAFPECENIQDNLFNLDYELIGFCVKCVQFFRKHPIRNVIRVAWSSFESVFQQSMNKIREYRELIELEAFAANVEGSIRRHQELKSILAQKTSNQRVSIRLPCHCILFQQNPRFSGRDAALDHLTSSLISDKSAVQRSLAVVGLGGVGKTQLATQFAWQHVVDFEVILWAQADSLQKLEQSYVHFARKLGLLDGLDTSDVSHVVESVVAWFEETAVPWLIVFDNVDDGKILRSFWPIAQKGALLITARNTTSSFTPAAEIFHLRSFSNEEGSQMILRTLELKDQSLTETDTELAMQLSIILGGLPLALAQTIGYITTVQCSIPDFLETYNEQRQSGSGLFSPRSFGDFNYEHTLSTVWDMTLSKMDERSNLLLSMLAFLDPDRIPESLFQDGKPTCVATAEKLFLPTKAEYFDLLATLCAYDLVKRDPEKPSLSMHRLVQEAVRQRMTSESWLSTFAIVIDILAAMYPRQVLGMRMETFWAKCNLYLPQVLSVASFYDSMPSVDTSTMLPTDHSVDDRFLLLSKTLAELLHNATWFMQEKGMFEQLLPIVKLGIQILERVHEEDSLLMGELYNTLGNVHLEIGNLDECKESFLKVKYIREKHRPPDDPIVANIHNNLSLAETALGHYETAVELSYKVISIRENLDDSQYAEYKENTLPINYSNLCRILYTMGRLEGATEIGYTAVELAKKAFGLKSKNTAQAIFNLADVRMKQNHGQALDLHLEALRLRKEILGSHYQTAGSCYKVACLLQKEGELAHARELMEEALSMYEAAYAAKGGVARTLFQLSIILAEEGKEGPAMETLTRAEALRKELIKSTPNVHDPATSFDDLVPYVDR